MKFNVFTYGSLAIPEVMEVVVDCELEHTEARLHGYERFILRDRPYPAIVHTGENSTDGRLYFDLTQKFLHRLDYFEDDYYSCESVLVETSDNRNLEAVAYVLPGAQRDLLGPEPWDEVQFREVHLQRQHQLSP